MRSFTQSRPAGPDSASRFREAHVWISDLPDAIENWAENHPGAVFAIWSVLFFTAAVMRSSARPLWSDELFTYYIATMPTDAGWWGILNDGVDALPPLYQLFVRPSARLLGESALGIRLPEMLGLWVGCSAVFLALRKRLSTLWAVCAALLLSLVFVAEFAADARSYGLALGASGVALACWFSISARGPSVSRVLGLGAALAMATGFHYFSVLLVPALALGELSWSREHKRTRIQVWAALASPLAVLLLSIPFMRGAEQFIPGFWARPSIVDIPRTYYYLLDPLMWWLLAAAAILLGARALFGVEYRRAPAAGLSRHEWAVVGAIVLIPVASVLLGLTITHVYTPRYSAIAIFGIVISLAALAPLASGRRSALLATIWLGGALAVSPIALFRTENFGKNRQFSVTYRHASAHQLLTGTLHSGIPVLISSQHLFLELYSQLPQPRKNRISTVLSAAAARRFTGSDTADLNLIQLNRWIPMTTLTLDQMRSERRFYLLDDPEFQHAWLTAWLLESGAELRVIRRAGTLHLYEGHWPE